MINFNELTGRFAKVGFSNFSDLILDENIETKLWESDYAEVFVVDASSSTKADLEDLLQRLDSAIAKRLRAAREAGEQREAHVCIIFDGTPISRGDLKSESEISRYVSRKYWIDNKSPIDHILRRLSLAWIDIQEQFSNDLAKASDQLQVMREHIMEKKGAGAAKEFLSGLGAA